jgi:2-polyprenyl-3-methyl-5-hydroxy-6-metoxy-1,4-benzoquinol methylase
MTHSKSSTIVENRPQNIYDDPAFFAGYKKLRQNDTGLNGALEVPALRRLLPDLHDKQILDLGCGFGDFARYACENGAISVTAIDISSKMLTEAARLTSGFCITYLHCAIEDYMPEPDSFDLVVASMALHYVADYCSVVQSVFSTLRPGGRFVFSVEHPICTANPIGWILDEHGQEQYWPLDRYQDEGWRSTKWFVDGVRKFHRTVATYVNPLLEAGFVLNCLGEPCPTAIAISNRPELKIHYCRPPILLLACIHP